MKIFNNFIDLNIKKDMGITGITDEFFCVYLHNLFEKYNKWKISNKKITNNIFELTYPQRKA